MVVGDTTQALLPVGLAAMSKPPAPKYTALTVPAAVSRPWMGTAPAEEFRPGRVIWVQLVPPLWVAQSWEPYAQPSCWSAKRTPSTPLPPASDRKVVGGGVTLVQVVPPSWVRASARLPPTVPSTQPSWDETKVTEAASKPAMGVGAGVAGTAVEVGEAVVMGEVEQPEQAVTVAVEVAPRVGVGWVVVPPQAATSATSASRAWAAPGLGPCIRVMEEILRSGGVRAPRRDRAPCAGLAAPLKSLNPIRSHPSVTFGDAPLRDTAVNAPVAGSVRRV